MGSPDSVSRVALLRELGYGHPDAAARATAILVAAGLVNPRREHLAAAKREAVRVRLAETLLRACDRCAARLPGGESRERVPVAAPGDCERCGGSSNRSAIQRAADAFVAARLSRLLVVGGSPGVHQELRRLWPPALELRIVDGTERHTRAEARGLLGWADAVVVWASSELDHKVSEHYTRAGDPKVFIVPRRGIEAVAEALAAHCLAGSRR